MEEGKLSLFANDILYIENRKDSTKHMLNLIHRLSKFQDINQYTKIGCISTH